MIFDFESVKTQELSRALESSDEFNSRQTEALEAYRKAALLKVELTNPTSPPSITKASS